MNEAKLFNGPTYHIKFPLNFRRKKQEFQRFETRELVTGEGIEYGGRGGYG